MNPYKVFHSPCEFLRNQIHLVLVRPEEPGNLGAALRARANMGIRGRVFVVGQNEAFLTGEAEKFAMHAKEDLKQVKFSPDLASVLESAPQRLALAATARIGSSKRPHPLWVDSAMERAVSRLRDGSYRELFLVFGSEGSGLDNADLSLCDWVVTIPSVEQYRSLNLAQAILVFLYEANRQLLARPAEFSAPKMGQRDRLVAHLLQIAKDSGFILPGDPHKMRAKLETIFAALPPHLPEAQTLHGLLEQISRNLSPGDIQYKGRYKREVEVSPTIPIMKDA
ncbi:MAG: RNA methyltransferase [Bdellovibrionaceae bacterium]|nr:RNA methyltransferase [Pseudobdellovibrionaceae bacterium]